MGAMQDDLKGLRRRSPYQPSQRVTTLSPLLESYKGPQDQYGPMDAEQPLNLIGLVPEGSDNRDVPDDKFRSWPEDQTDRALRGQKWPKGGKNGKK